MLAEIFNTSHFEVSVCFFGRWARLKLLGLGRCRQKQKLPLTYIHSTRITLTSHNVQFLEHRMGSMRCNLILWWKHEQHEMYIYLYTECDFILLLFYFFLSFIVPFWCCCCSVMTFSSGRIVLCMCVIFAYLMNVLSSLPPCKWHKHTNPFGKVSSIWHRVLMLIYSLVMRCCASNIFILRFKSLSCMIQYFFSLYFPVSPTQSYILWKYFRFAFVRMATKIQGFHVITQFFGM